MKFKYFQGLEIRLLKFKGFQGFSRRVRTLRLVGRATIEFFLSDCDIVIKLIQGLFTFDHYTLLVSFHSLIEVNLGNKLHSRNISVANL